MVTKSSSTPMPTSSLTAPSSAPSNSGVLSFASAVHERLGNLADNVSIINGAL